MYTDASEDGYGVFIFDDHRVLSDAPIIIVAGRWSSQERKSSINLLELRAWRIGIRTISERKDAEMKIGIQGHIDSTTARSWILRNRAPTYAANQIAAELTDDMPQHNLELHSLEYVQSKRNFADKPSRKYPAQSAKSTSSF
jgi:hypothetical protein